MSSEKPAVPDEKDPGWPEMSAEETAELRQAFADANANHKKGLSIPRDEVLPRLRRAG